MPRFAVIAVSRDRKEPAGHIGVLPAEEIAMAQKFDPAPYDKHAADSMKAAKADRDMHEDLKSGLVGTFPASDPVSATQPAKTRHDDESPPSLWSRIVSAFR
jgi:hypothetical protein